VEVHLATGFQNIVYDSRAFPQDLLARVYQYLDKNNAGERKSGETDEQFHYNTRKKAFGEFKKELWTLPAPAMQAIMKELEDRFSLIFHKLNVTGSDKLVKKYT
jgi:hypothetical protein